MTRSKSKRSPKTTRAPRTAPGKTIAPPLPPKPMSERVWMRRFRTAGKRLRDAALGYVRALDRLGPDVDGAEVELRFAACDYAEAARLP